MLDCRPWLASYGEVPPTLAYPEGTLYDVVLETVRRVPDAVAYDFLGTNVTYQEFGEGIDRCAAALAALGVSAGDRVTISMPTTPQGLIAFYAAAKLGAVSSMIHPLSAPAEIETYVNMSRSRVALTLDAFHDRFAGLLGRTSLETLILARIPDYLPAAKRAGFWLTRGRRIPKVPEDAPVLWWSQLMRETHPPVPRTPTDTDALASILYSGGTTGAPKGIMLSHRNVNAEGRQVATWVGIGEDDVVLAALPIFHGFGLGAMIHSAFMSGAKVVLVPIFSPKAVADVMRKKRPTLMAGVPTLYEALARDASLRKADLSCLRAAFSGADTLARPVKERFEQLVAERGGRVRLLEGYGLTEAVSAVIGTPLHDYREGRAGVPLPDMLVKICRPGATDELAPGAEGELCVSGPTVMIGYLDNPDATAAALEVHEDGRVWLRTGDLGRIDEDGWVTFTCRLKRMIKSSGFNVYPAEVEAVLYRHPEVEAACVIGVPDEAQGERVKAFVVVRDPMREGPQLAAELIEHCRGQLIKWSCPRDVEFRRELPMTKYGKVDFTALARNEQVPVELREPAGAVGG